MKRFISSSIFTAMSFLDYFSGHSDLYRSARPTYPDELFAWVALQAPGRERVWDCATGNGQAAAGLAPYFETVLATDASARQLANAVQVSNVTYSLQPAEKTEFPDNYFDAVCVAQALHWFDHDRFYPEVHRVLRPGGIFAAWVYSEVVVDPVLDPILQEQIITVIAPYWSPQNVHSHNGYRDLPFPFEPVEVPRFTITVDWNLPQLMAFIETWSATQKLISEQGTGFLEQAVQKIAETWGDPETLRQVEMPIALKLGRFVP